MRKKRKGRVSWGEVCKRTQRETVVRKEKRNGGIIKEYQWEINENIQLKGKLMGELETERINRLDNVQCQSTV
jgi:hypothetical protein